MELKRNLESKAGESEVPQSKSATTHQPSIQTVVRRSRSPLASSSARDKKISIPITLEHKRSNEGVSHHKRKSNLLDSEYKDELDIVEGREDDEIKRGDYPLDSVYIRQTSRTVGEVVDRIKRDRFILDPEFQRVLVWDQQKQSKLIESCLMRIPLPVFYVAELKSGKVTIVDGLQRILTFMKFIENEFELRLNKGKTISEKDGLSGKTFEDLSIKLQERILDTELTMYILDSDTPPKAKLDIFERVNSGVPLTRQQMRNALYTGPATRLLGRVVKGEVFKSVIGRALNASKMRDREAVNRFVSFTLCNWENYKGDMDAFLEEGLEALANLESNERLKLKDDFEKTLQFCRDIFGANVFRKSMSEKIKQAMPINMSLFDVMTVTFMKYKDKLNNLDKNQLKKNIINLLDRDDFNDSITQSTNSTKAVRLRYQSFESLIEKLYEGMGK